jgi:aminopeptidase-like protein
MTVSKPDLKGELIYSLAERLYPICRSITGNGVRETLRIVQEHIPLEIHEVPTGTPVLDWTIPKEWNIREAWIKGPEGKKIVDFADHNLHVLNYSAPIHRKVDLEELNAHLFSLPDKPDLIPYRTSYYNENWGFCLPHRQREQLSDGEYEVFIDSDLKEGHLTYGELYIPGETEQEFLMTAHVCHPSLANDNLSGIGVLTFLAQHLMQQKNRYSYRFLFIPGTIGSITWLARNEDKVSRIQHGIVATLLGDAGHFHYKKSRRGHAEIDRAIRYVFEEIEGPHEILDFFPYGYDERQFCSPGFNLPVGNLTRSQFGQYSEYHTSGDNLDLIKPEQLEGSYQLYLRIVKLLEQNRVYLNQSPKGEPQLGKRGLYEAIGGQSDQKDMQMAMLWVLNFADGEHSLLDIAIRSGIPFDQIARISEILLEKGLLLPADG